MSRIVVMIMSVLPRFRATKIRDMFLVAVQHPRQRPPAGPDGGLVR